MKPTKAHSHYLCFLLQTVVDSCISAEMEIFPSLHCDACVLRNMQTAVASLNEPLLRKTDQCECCCTAKNVL